MIRMTLVGDRERKLKYKTLDGARKGAQKALGTTKPRRDPDGYAVGIKGDCLFFVEDCCMESIFPETCKCVRKTVPQHHYVRKEGSQEIIAEATTQMCLKCFHSTGTVATTWRKAIPFNFPLSVNFEIAAREALTLAKRKIS